MRKSSSSFVVVLEGRSRLDDGPEHIHASPCERDDGLVVAFPLAPFAVVEGAAVAVSERAKGGLVEDALQPLVAAVGPSEEAGLARLLQHGRDAAGGGERVGGAEAVRSPAWAISSAVSTAPMPGRLWKCPARRRSPIRSWHSGPADGGSFHATAECVKRSNGCAMSSGC